MYNLFYYFYMIFNLKKKKWGLRNQFLDELRDADVLNKIDLPESGKNIENFCRKYDEASTLIFQI